MPGPVWGERNSVGSEIHSASETTQLQNEPRNLSLLCLLSLRLPVSQGPESSSLWLPVITCIPTCPSEHRADAALAWLLFRHLCHPRDTAESPERRCEEKDLRIATGSPLSRGAVASSAYQGWRDLGPQPSGEHVAPVASLRRRTKRRVS